MRHIPTYFERGESGQVYDSLTKAGRLASRGEGVRCTVMYDKNQREVYFTRGT